MPLDQMAIQPIPNLEGRLQMDPGPHSKILHCNSPAGLFGELDFKPPFPHLYSG